MIYGGTESLFSLFEIALEYKRALASKRRELLVIQVDTFLNEGLNVAILTCLHAIGILAVHD